MTSKDFETRRYQPEHKPDIIELLSLMWGQNQERNLQHFDWKYEHNPFTDEPECYFALDKNRIVGFLGYFVNRWQLWDSKVTLKLPVGSDLIVHPEYRNKGLMTALHEASFKELPKRYPAILVFSPNKDSAPRAMTLGFRPLTEIKRLKKYRFSSLLKRKGREASSSRPFLSDMAASRVGTFGPIEVRETPLPGPLGDFHRRRGSGTQKIALLRDEDFYAWRFKSERRKYFFYYYWEKDELRGYLILRRLGHPPGAVILDFEQTDSAVFDELLRFVLKHSKWSTITIWDIHLEKEIRRILRKRNFIPSRWAERFLSRSAAEPCILIRPPKKEFAEEDLFFQNLDLRQLQNWDFKEICSDIS